MITAGGGDSETASASRATSPLQDRREPAFSDLTVDGGTAIGASATLLPSLFASTAPAARRGLSSGFLGGSGGSGCVSSRAAAGTEAGGGDAAGGGGRTGVVSGCASRKRLAALAPSLPRGGWGKSCRGWPAASRRGSSASPTDTPGKIGRASCRDRLKSR